MAPIVVKNFNETSTILLISIYRLIIVTGYTPRNWRVNKMIFLAKPGKSDFSSAKSYRPITLSTTLLKIFERVLLWEMSDHIPQHLSNQYAFQACSSCEHAISRVVDVIEASLATRQVTVTLFLDIQGAFDNILFAPIIARLRHYGVPESLCRVIDYQLRNRLTVVKLGKTSAAGAPVRGTPQGGFYRRCTGTWLWIVFLPRLPESTRPFTRLVSRTTLHYKLEESANPQLWIWSPMLHVNVHPGRLPTALRYHIISPNYYCRQCVTRSYLQQ